MFCSLFSSPEYAQFWVFCDACVSLTTFRCCRVCFCFALHVVSALGSQATRSKACISAANYELLPFFLKQCCHCFQVIFTENKMKRKRSDGESAKAVREQVFLSRYESETCVVKSFVSKSYAYCQY